MKKNFLALLILTTAWAVRPVAANPVSLNLLQPDLVGTPGVTVTWQYDVTNNSGGTIYGLAVNAGIWLSGIPDATVFDGFGPNGLADGTSMQGTLYAFTADPAVQSSFNSGVFDVSVLLSDNSVADLFTDYSVTIAPPVGQTPEPGSWPIVGVMSILLGVRGARRWRRRAA